VKFLAVDSTVSKMVHVSNTQQLYKAAEYTKAVEITKDSERKISKKKGFFY